MSDDARIQPMSIRSADRHFLAPTYMEGRICGERRGDLVVLAVDTDDGRHELVMVATVARSLAAELLDLAATVKPGCVGEVVLNFPDLSASFELPRETIAEMAANLAETADKADACLAKARAVLKGRHDVAQMIAPWLEDVALRLVQADPLASQDVLVDRLAACSARIYDAMAISMVRGEDAAGIGARVRACVEAV